MPLHSYKWASRIETRRFGDLIHYYAFQMNYATPSNSLVGRKPTQQRRILTIGKHPSEVSLYPVEYLMNLSFGLYGHVEIKSCHMGLNWLSLSSACMHYLFPHRIHLLTASHWWLSMYSVPNIMLSAYAHRYYPFNSYNTEVLSLSLGDMFWDTCH